MIEIIEKVITRILMQFDAALSIGETMDEEKLELLLDKIIRLLELYARLKTL